MMSSKLRRMCNLKNTAPWQQFAVLGEAFSLECANKASHKSRALRPLTISQ